MTKRLDGRDETILDPEIEIVDAHHHLFLRTGMNYMLDDYLEDARAGHRIVASVYSETKSFARSDGPELLRPIGEVEFANGVGAMCASGQYGDVLVAAAIVGHADMRHGDEVARLLDECIERAPERFRGVRQITLEHDSDLPFRFIPARPPTGLLESDEFRAAFAHLGPRQLMFDAAVFDHQLPLLAQIADAFPDTPITLNHLGMMMGMGLESGDRAATFASWRQRLADIAQRPSVFCKIGGLGLPFWGFGLETRDTPVGYLELAEIWRPYVETALELFGPDRCMAESNYPPDSRSCGFVPAWNALKYLAAGLASEDKRALFHDTAVKVHRMELPSRDVTA